LQIFEGFPMKFTEDDAYKVIQEMENAPPKVRPLSIRELILRIAPGIDEMRRKGYTWDDVIEFLKARGVDISVGSLRGYLSPGARKQKNKRSATRKRVPREAGSKAGAGAKQDGSVKKSESVSQEQRRKEEKSGNPVFETPLRSSGFRIKPDPDII